MQISQNKTDPVGQTLQGSETNCFQGSDQLWPQGSSAPGFSSEITIEISISYLAFSVPRTGALILNRNESLSILAIFESNL